MWYLFMFLNNTFLLYLGVHRASGNKRQRKRDEMTVMRVGRLHQSKIRGLPDRSGSCQIEIRQLPDLSGPRFVSSLVCTAVTDFGRVCL